MKKFCSKCGTQLDLGKRACTSCNAFNPYFIAGFTSNPAEPAEEKQETAVNHILAENAAMQKENAAEIESLKLEQLEQQKNEQELKNQLLKVKEETEQFKKETFNLVKDVQKELHDIEQENKLLKEKVELLKTATVTTQTDAPVTRTIVTEKKNENQKGLTAIAAILLLIIVTGVSYYFFSSNTQKPTVNTTSPAKATTPASGNADIAHNSTSADTMPAKRLLAVATPPAVTKPATITPAAEKSVSAPAAPKASAERFALTESKLKSDLAGKKLSGCDITIKNSAEVVSVGNLVLVDKLSASYLKYKCNIKVIQSGNVYTSTPYIYYSAEGTFIKVDGTNCE